jgi:hypothetical protein
LVAQVRALASCRPLLLAVDGLASYVTCFQRAFRSPLPRHGARGRPRLRAWPEVVIVQVVKQRQPGLWQVTQRLVQGSQRLLAQLLTTSQGGGQINTAFIERLHGTFRQRLPWLTRRTRYLAQQAGTLQAGMYILGCIYNFCDYHESLHVRLCLSPTRGRWLRRTPAIAAGLTDHCWTFHELFTYRIPPPRWQPPPRRGRRSQQLQQLIAARCS